MASVVVRYGLGDVLGNEMGGAGQAKAFFPAQLPLALLFCSGLATIARRLGWASSRGLAGGLLAVLLALDALSPLVTTLWHYHWFALTT